MQQEDYFKAFEEEAQKLVDLTNRKNRNYANAEDAFANFAQIEILTAGRISREVGIFTRMTDKMSRIGNLLTGTEDLVGEAVEDTLRDLAVYSIILMLALREREQGIAKAITNAVEAAK